MKSSSDYVVYCIDGSMLAAVNHINFIEIVSFIFQLWACATPFQDLMVVGIDVYHDNTRKCGSIAGVVTSLNDLGMISHKKSLITIFGHKHKIKIFDIFHEKMSSASDFGSYLVSNFKIA